MNPEASPAAAAGAIPEWTLGWRLQRALSFAGVSVENIAAELGVARATISRWMHDKGAPPRTIYVRQWALRTGVEFEWLAGSPDNSDNRRSDREGFHTVPGRKPFVVALDQKRRRVAEHSKRAVPRPAAA